MQAEAFFGGLCMPKGEIAHDHGHPVHKLRFVAQIIDVGENNNESIVQHIFSLRPILDVAETKIEQLWGMGLIELSQDLWVELRSADRFPMILHHDRLYL